MPELDATFVFSAGMQLLVLLLAISLHESAHAWTADRRGDPTAREAGRVSLNPLRHLDPVGSLILPLVLLVAGGPVFGWARPTPVVLEKLRRPQHDHLLVTLAGPASNLAVGLGATVLLGVAAAALGEEARQAAYLSLLRDVDGASRLAHFPLMFTLVHMAFLNAFLGIFNLLPIPPLDGGQVALHLLPPAWASKLAAIRPFGFMIVLALAMLNLLSLLVLPIYVALSLVIQLAG